MTSTAAVNYGTREGAIKAAKTRKERLGAAKEMTSKEYVRDWGAEAGNDPEARRQVAKDYWKGKRYLSGGKW